MSTTEHVRPEVVGPSTALAPTSPLPAGFDRPDWLTEANQWLAAIATRADALLGARKVQAAIEYARKVGFAEPVIAQGRLLVIEIYRRGLSIDPGLQVPSTYAAPARASAPVWRQVSAAAMAYVDVASEAPSWRWLVRATWDYMGPAPAGVDMSPAGYAARTAAEISDERATKKKAAKTRQDFNARARGLSLDELARDTYRTLVELGADEFISIIDLFEEASLVAKREAFREAMTRRFKIGYPQLEVTGTVVGLAEPGSVNA